MSYSYMIDLYLRFPIPDEDKLLSFSDTVKVDNKNRLPLPSIVREVFTNKIFDILVFNDTDIPYVQLFPKDYLALSYRSFLEKWQNGWIDQSYITSGALAFDEYKSRANSVTVGSHNRIVLPSLAATTLRLQSVKEIHMVMSYPWLKLYTLDDYNRLIKTHENTNR